MLHVRSYAVGESRCFCRSPVTPSPRSESQFASQTLAQTVWSELSHEARRPDSRCNKHMERTTSEQNLHFMPCQRCQYGVHDAIPYRPCCHPSSRPRVAFTGVHCMPSSITSFHPPGGSLICTELLGDVSLFAFIGIWPCLRAAISLFLLILLISLAVRFLLLAFLHHGLAEAFQKDHC